MNEVERLVAALVSSSAPLRRDDLTSAARAFAPDVAPLAGDEVLGAAVDEIVGLGPLERLLDDPEVSDVLVNGPDEVWAERRGRLARTEVAFRNADSIVALVRRVIAPLGLRVDRASPAVDARLADGSRLHAVIPPAAVDGPIVAIRRFHASVTGLGDVVERGALDDATADALAAAVEARDNILVAGHTGAGKTTLLNVLCAEIPSDERVVTIEDAAELSLTGHVVRLEARSANVEGEGGITIRDLLRYALRLRPDRIVVGEVRGPEALDMLQALTTGHRGSMSTIHADGVEEALVRLETLAAMAPDAVPHHALSQLVAAAVDLVVVVRREHGRRSVVALERVGE